MKKTIFALTGSDNTELDIQSDTWWTGKPPIYGTCPGVQKDGTITSLPLVHTNSSRKELLDYFDNTWTLTESLFSSLKESRFIYARAYHKLRHPMIFYYIHPVAFYVNKLNVSGLIDGTIAPELEALFETGVDEMRWDDLHDGKSDIWPSLETAHAYRQKVYNLVKHLIETHPSLEEGQPPITQNHPLWALIMAFEHERIHLETSSVLLREIDTKYLQTPACWPKHLPDTSESYDNALISLPKTTVKLGKPDDWPSFGWDNEYGSETRNTAPFNASKHLISNAEFLEFVKDGGYRSKQYWSEEGWKWRSFRNIKWPTFWVQDGATGSHRFKLRILFEVIDMQNSYPVIANFHEAKAYCTWLTAKENSQTPYRLLTEAEHHAIHDTPNYAESPACDRILEANGLAFQKHGINGNLSYGSEIAVNALIPNNKGFYDSSGNVWQWCEDHFHPFKGAAPHPYYDDFSAPCYDGEHQIILGGSFISTGDEASVWARFHFRPHFFQHAGFRIVRPEKTDAESNAVLIKQATTNKYEQDDTIHQYLLMHYGSESEKFNASLNIQFPPTIQLPDECAKFAHKYAKKFDKALDLGCAVGAAGFKLAEHFNHVTGIDYSQSFVNVANQLKDTGAFPYKRHEIGDIYTDMTAKIAPNIDRNRTIFEQGDACNLPDSLQNFDAVILSNVICRLPNPSQCLQRMSGVNGLVKSGGVLVLTAPYSWYEAFSPKEQWITGNGNPLDSLKILLSNFELLEEKNLPFVIREHQRKFEYIITHATIWRRIS